MDVKIRKEWKELLEGEFNKEYFKDLVDFVRKEYSQAVVYPNGSDIFKAFDLTAPEDVKVVIIGQDPYHTPGVANGLAFSVNPDKNIPPSLKNIYKEINSDLEVDPPSNGDLTFLAKQGVLLLNATLTVRKSSPGSHQKKGWEEFTNSIIKVMSEKYKNIVFILWGKYAQDKGEIINVKDHYIIKSPHPSPFSANRGFFGSKPFSKTNKYLESVGKRPIKWTNK